MPNWSPGVFPKLGPRLVLFDEMQSSTSERELGKLLSERWGPMMYLNGDSSSNFELRDRWRRDGILREIFGSDGKLSSSISHGSGFNGEYQIFLPPVKLEDVYAWLNSKTHLNLSPSVLISLAAQRRAAAEAIIAYMKAQHPDKSLYIPAAGPEQDVEKKAALMLEIQLSLPQGPQSKWKHSLAQISFKLVDFYRGTTNPNLVTFADFIALYEGDTCPADLAAAAKLWRSQTENPSPLDLK